MADIKKTCACGSDFYFTERDQEFYKDKGYTPPKRCKPCREVKKKSFGDETHTR